MCDWYKELPRNSRSYFVNNMIMKTITFLIFPFVFCSFPCIFPPTIFKDLVFYCYTHYWIESMYSLFFFYLLIFLSMWYFMVDVVMYSLFFFLPFDFSKYVILNGWCWHLIFWIIGDMTLGAFRSYFKFYSFDSFY